MIPRVQRDHERVVPVEGLAEPAGQILLVPQALIGRQKNLVSFPLGQLKQLTVVFLRPTLLRQRIHRVRWKMVPQRRRRALIE